MEEDILEPINAYSQKYKAQHYENVVNYFDDLVKKSGVDVAKNKETVTKFHNQEKVVNDTNRILSSSKGKKGLLIAAMIIIAIGLFIGAIALFNNYLYLSIIFFVLIVGDIVGFNILMKKTINKVIAQLEKKLSDENAKAEELKNDAFKEMAPLNALFDWNIPGRILNKTIPLLVMDENFDEARFTLMAERYGLKDNLDPTISTYYVQSGSILGNPFVINTDHIQSWKWKTYTGSMIIHWTTTVKTKDGWETVHHTETLIASLQKEVPHYRYDTYLIYANEAAPDLSFSRKPSKGSSLDDKSLINFVKKEAKALDKKSTKDIKNGGDYTRLGNDTFEVLFGGEDRDNEMEFRLLYTPLAQKNIINLLRSKEGYGDDFVQKKWKKINLVRSEHSQHFDYYATPLNYIDYDYEQIKEKFVSYNAKYFKGLFFDLAPLLSIPLYQQYKAKEFIYDKPYKKNFSSYEHEAIANSFDKSKIVPPGAVTPSIIKTTFNTKNGDADEISITAHAFKGVQKVDYVPTFGGDGRTHMVPVWYIDYIPISKTTNMVIEKKNSSRSEYNETKDTSSYKDALAKFTSPANSLFERGIFAALVNENYNRSALNEFNKIYKGNPEIKKSTKVDIDNLVKKILNEKQEEKDLNLMNQDFDKSDELLKDKQNAVEE